MIQTPSRDEKITCTHVEIKHFIAELKLCCRTLGGWGVGGRVKTDKKKMLKDNVTVLGGGGGLLCNCDKQPDINTNPTFTFSLSLEVKLRFSK